MNDLSVSELMSHDDSSAAGLRTLTSMLLSLYAMKTKWPVTSSLAAYV